MGKKVNAVPIINEEVERAKQLPKKNVGILKALTDNVIVEIFWNEPEPVKEGERFVYVAPHIRGVKFIKVLSVGALVNESRKDEDKVSAGEIIHIPGMGFEVARDEESAICIIKGHDIMAILES